MESCGTVERRWKHLKPNGRHDRLSNSKKAKRPFR
jgi:hypothetical protein